MRENKKSKNKSLRLAVYFGFLVFLIIATSIVFKGIELVQRSKFDGKHRFTIAVLGDQKSVLLSVAPGQGSFVIVEIPRAFSISDLKKMSVPVDAYITSSSDSLSKKSFFTKSILTLSKHETNLTIIDLIRLGLFSSGFDSEKINEVTLSKEDTNKLSTLVQDLFKDQSVIDEKISIQVTNSTPTQGLGNKVANYITNIGGSVVLVKSTSEEEQRSKIYYFEKSYTAEKISKYLNIPLEKTEKYGIADVIIILGKDREGLFNQ